MREVGNDVKEAAKITFRIIATVIGFIGVLIAVITDILYATGSAIFGGHSHPWYGMLVVLVAFIGAVLALFRPAVAALVMAVAAIAFFFVVGGWAAFASVVLLIAALVAFLDRGNVRPAK